MSLSRERLEAAYQTALETLLAERHPDGYWVGELSTSALSTATAVMALIQVQKHAPGLGRRDQLIADGLQWLIEHQNADGGWGDTVKSISNISTTMLCRAALTMAEATPPPNPLPEAERGSQKALLRFGEGLGRGAVVGGEALRHCESWLFERYGKTPAELAEAVRQRYGKDRTFSVPILTTCALAGLVEWKEVPPLPFELACFPQSWFRFLRLQVVSYALPALIAIGQCIHHHKKPWNPFTRLTRWLAQSRSLRVLETIQPSNGGFLEATPLTSFVTLSLASCGLGRHPVVRKGLQFIVNSVRPDGSWPIDTNLSTWVTTLSINALAAAGELDKLERKEQVRDWLLAQQYRERHPYTGAEPGGWAWTPLPGGVPDADDTPGALLALLNLGDANASLTPFWNGQRWLDLLRNSDGGWPTFCRGWGHLPFDRSGADLTAHVLRAFAATFRWHMASSSYTIPFDRYMDGDSIRPDLWTSLAYLARTQRRDGSWLPLWFGNQHAPNDENPTYGTARVLAAYRDLDRMNEAPAQRGIQWLLANQNDDGGWGGCKGTPSSTEETALAVEILASGGRESTARQDAVNRGLLWLVERVEDGTWKEPSPIGFYFAKLWYFEKLYPLIWTVAALGRARRACAGTENHAS